jgi:hypothetical protein
MENLQPPFDRMETWIAAAVGIIILISILGWVVRTVRCLVKMVVIGIALGLVALGLAAMSGII